LAEPPAAEPKSAEPKSGEFKSGVSVSAEPPSAGSPPAEPSSTGPGVAEPISAEPAQAEPSRTELAPVSLQALANAYRDYTRKSIEEFGSFVEQLSGARSLDKAVKVHTEFVKRAYENSMAESKKIYELHNRFAKQTLDPFKALTGKTPAPPGKP
jgi:phasin family protein